MKRIYNILGIIFIMTCCMACGKENTDNTKGTDVNDVVAEDYTFEYNSDMRYAERYQRVSLSEAGIIYDDDDNGIVRLVTVDEGSDMAFCYNPNCTHPNAKATYGDPECMAALYEGLMCRTAYYNGTLYFFVSDGVFAHKVYAMDTNGAGRKLLAKLPFFGDIGYFAIFKDDKVYYTAMMPYSDEITNTGGYKKRAVEVSLRDGSYRFITEETENTLSKANIAGDTMYIRYYDMTDSGRLYVTKIDLNTLEETVIISKDEWKAGNRYIDAYDGDSYYYWDKNTFEVGIKNIDGTVEKVLLRGAEGEEYTWIDPSCDGIFYDRTYDYEDEPAGFYFMDLKTEEVTNITEEADKYNLKGYDGYYGAFVAYDNEFNHSMWSKEKVLGEAKAR